MNALEQIVRGACPGVSTVFREKAYGSVQRQGLIRDVLGLSNALVDGPRYLVMGVRDDPSSTRKFLGVPTDEIDAAQNTYSELITRFIEPKLHHDFHVLSLEGARILVLVLNRCSSTPYLLKESISNSMREGSGWILNAGELLRLRRADLQLLFEKMMLKPAPEIGVRIEFEGQELPAELTLAALDLKELPSRVAGDKYRKLMEVKQASRSSVGAATTRIERLVHLREFGNTRPYERSSESSLMRRLDTTEQDCATADDIYRFETRAHQVNMTLTNSGGVELVGTQLTLRFPRIDGFGISERLCSPGPSCLASETDYPVVSITAHNIAVQAGIGSLLPAATMPAFSQALRVWVRSELVGRTLPVDFQIDADNLDEPVAGTLKIHVCAESPGTETTEIPRNSCAG